MKRRLLLALGAVALVGGYLGFRGTERANPADPAAVADCRPVTFEGRRFTECVAIPGRHRIETRITGSNGVIYRGFAALSLDFDASEVAFAVNGGMYDTGSKPIGYYVEDGDRLYPLNGRDGSGNFYLKPNGVFFGEAEGAWRVLPSEDFAAQVSQRAQFGTQSGPMLLVDGELHPELSPTGTSLKIRNAVGVDASGRAHFVISDEPVSFGTMARVMRDHAKTDDALFLDGTVSGVWYPEGGRLDARYPLGPLIVVSRIRTGSASGSAGKG